MYNFGNEGQFVTLDHHIYQKGLQMKKIRRIDSVLVAEFNCKDSLRTNQSNID